VPPRSLPLRPPSGCVSSWRGITGNRRLLGLESMLFVALPSVPSSLGAVVGEAYQVPESTPAPRPLGLQPKNQQDACGGGALRASETRLLSS